MQLSDKHTLQFQRLYQEEYGIALSREEAFERGSKLVDLLRIIYKPITEASYQKYKNK